MRDMNEFSTQKLFSFPQNTNFDVVCGVHIEKVRTPRLAQKQYASLDSIRSGYFISEGCLQQQSCVCLSLEEREFGI